MDVSFSCNIGHVLDNSPCNGGGHGNTWPSFFRYLHRWLRPGILTFFTYSQSISFFLAVIYPLVLLLMRKPNIGFCSLLNINMSHFSTLRGLSFWVFEMVVWWDTPSIRNKEKECQCLHSFDINFQFMPYGNDAKFTYIALISSHIVSRPF